MKKMIDLRGSLKLAMIALSLLMAANVQAQDFHMSQYDMMPLYINPAQTGMYFGQKKTNYRFAGDFRSQWQKLQGKPYSSVGIGYDMPFQRFGVGLLMMDHIAGTSNTGTFQFLASGAYKITSDKSKNHFLSAGLQIGLFQKKFSYRDLLFENQYNIVDGLDPNTPNGEDLPDLSILRFDANLGMYYKYVHPNKMIAPSVGFSVYHVNTPDESFTGEKHDLPMRFNGTLACDINVNDELMFTPNALYMYQGKATELNAGLMMAYTIAHSDYDILCGGSYRHKDAAVVHLGMKQGNNIFRVSYDIVTSPLKNYGGGRGGFELGVIYSGWLRGNKGRM